MIVSVTRWNKENVEDRFEFGGDEGEVEDDDESKSDLGVIVVLILVGEDVGVGGVLIFRFYFSSVIAWDYWYLQSQKYVCTDSKYWVYCVVAYAHLDTCHIGWFLDVFFIINKRHKSI